MFPMGMMAKAPEKECSTAMANGKRIPCGCLKRSYTQTWCGRELSDKEFVFEDARYAVQFYANSNVIRACDACVRTFKSSELASEGVVSGMIRGMGR